MKITPLWITLLIEIHAYACTEDQKVFSSDSPASAMAFNHMVDEGLIELDNEIDEKGYCPWRTTARGKRMVQKLCETPLPYLEEKWI